METSKPFRAWQARMARECPDIFRTMNQARRAVAYARRVGWIVRPNACEACSRIATVEAAHHDYARALDVRWLCRSCHTRWDRRSPKVSPPWCARALRRPLNETRALKPPSTEPPVPIVTPEGRFSPGPDGQLVKRRRSRLAWSTA